MAAQNKGKILYTLHVIHILPFVVFAIVILIVGMNRITNSMYDQAKNELENISRILTIMYDTLYPGDYTVVGDDTCMTKAPLRAGAARNSCAGGRNRIVT